MMNKQKEYAIEVDSVSKEFILPHSDSNSIKATIIHPFKNRTKKENQKALMDVSFKVEKGSFYGVVGRNGSGKSTLLKLLAGVYKPTLGSIKTKGSLVPFIELGVGFNPNLTGKENVYLNGALLGFSRKQINNMYDDIVSFAELEKFMDQKLNNYSSGMQVRLAFSIAIRAESDILLIDEVLAVGDINFQTKCYDVFKELIKKGKTIVFVTHNMADVERFCDKVLVLNYGKVIDICSPRRAKAKYFQLNEEKEVALKKADGVKREKSIYRWGSGEIQVKNIRCLKNGSKVNGYDKGEDITINIQLENKSLDKDEPIVIGMNVFSDNGENLIGPNTTKLDLRADIKSVNISVKKPNLNIGRYSVTVVVFDKTLTKTYDHLDKKLKFSIRGNQYSYGVLSLKTEWDFNE